MAALETCARRGGDMGGGGACCSAMRSAVGPAATILPDCLCIPGRVSHSFVSAPLAWAESIPTPPM